MIFIGQWVELSCRKEHECHRFVLVCGEEIKISLLCAPILYFGVHRVSKVLDMSPIPCVDWFDLKW